ncbi:hypothetical protein ACXN5S_05570 [Pseudoroseicyclus sp. H15]
MRSNLIPSLALALLVLGPAVVSAPPLAAQEASQGAQPGADDLRALRYYVEQDETAAISAEIRRLQLDFPDWTPPDDLSQLLVTGPSTEIDQIYARIASGDLGGARRLIDSTQAAFPNWTPPADMLSLLSIAEAQDSFDQAVSGGNLTTALELAIDNPQLLRCNRINNAWRLADLQARSGNEGAAFAAYEQVVQSCSGSSEIISTIEKADAVASVAQIRGLISTARNRMPSMAGTLDALETRLLSGRGIGNDDAPDEVAEVADEPEEEAPARAAAPAAPARQPAAAPAPAPAPRAAAPVSAAPVVVTAPPTANAYTSLPPDGDGRVNAVRAAALAENYTQCAFASTQPRSLEVAYERAWCVYNLDRPLEALALFTAAANGRLGGTVQRDALYGMSLSLLELEMTDSASAVAARTDFTYEQRRTIETIILDQRGVRAFEQGEFREAIRYFDELERVEGSLRRDLLLLRGYAMLNSGDQRGALQVFVELNNQLSTEETREAIAAARN